MGLWRVLVSVCISRIYILHIQILCYVLLGHAQVKTSDILKVLKTATKENFEKSSVCLMHPCVSMM